MSTMLDQSGQRITPNWVGCYGTVSVIGLYQLTELIMVEGIAAMVHKRFKTLADEFICVQ